MPTPTLAYPVYACAIITDSEGRCLLQLRPAGARHAANHLTCFGGRREPGEATEVCLLRELHEELGWRPRTIEATCDLHVGGRFIARFFACPMAPVVPVTTEAGHLALWFPLKSLAGLPISSWHRAVLMAVAGGADVVELSV